MKFGLKNKKSLTIWLIGIIAASIVIYLGISNINIVGKGIAWTFNLLFPLILGFVFALIFNVPMCFFEKHFWPKSKKIFANKIRRPLSLVLAIVIIFGVLAGVIVLIIPQLVQAIKILVDTIKETVNDLSALDKKTMQENAFLNFLVNLDWKSLLGKLEGLITDIGTDLMNGALGTVGNVFGGIFDFFVAFVFSVYILLSKEKLKKQASRLIFAWIPENVGDWIVHASTVASKNFRNFVAGQTIEALILGILCMLGMFLLRIPYAPTIGALVGVTALIPVVGAFIGGGVGAFMIVTESPVKALVFIIFLIVLQQLEGNFIYPKMMGDRINLPAMWVLAAVTVGGSLAGPMGMLFSVPLMSTLYVLIREETEKREECKKTIDSEIQRKECTDDEIH
ncbi:MAG: AI-2E family transporter [Clostridia bacterium]|nr:AI-2E family transporter [Clostridia bacterium]